MTQPTAPLAWTNGHVTVRLYQLETGVWRVETTQGHVVEAWSHSYPTEAVARSAARHVATAFRQWGTVRAIEVEDERLRLKVRDLLNSRRDTRRELGDVDAALDSIEDLNTWGRLALTAA